MSAAALPPGVTILPPPPELKLGDNEDERWRRPYPGRTANRERDTLAEAAAFPTAQHSESREALLGKQFACSGDVDTRTYAEAKRYRTMPDMGWQEARVALNRLRRGQGPIMLAEFALTAHGFEGFQGQRGEHAVKLRSENGEVLTGLAEYLKQQIKEADDQHIERPIPERVAAGREAWRGNNNFWTMIPVSDTTWRAVIDATPDAVIVALDLLRADHATWQARRAMAHDVQDRIERREDMPGADEYAQAVTIADRLVFTAGKLSRLYLAMLHSMPVWRVYPATPERDAVALWWPWGREPMLMDAAPPRRVVARRIIDPATITATRPSDVVKEVMRQNGIDRTTAQRLTAALRAKMRDERQRKAERLLAKGVPKAHVAREVGLSPSRISAMFKDQRQTLGELASANAQVVKAQEALSAVLEKRQVALAKQQRERGKRR
jgi:hypothetical protein